jgi:REP element-mobilizing transposase RayT
MKMIIKSVLARAQSLHPVRISDLLIMGNHVHFIITVACPQEVDLFMRYFKTESAHAVNHLMGRTKCTVWEEGYDSPPILTLHSLIEKVSYIYLNPADAGLVDNISEYPNFSTWKAFRGGEKEFSCKRVNRYLISPLPDGHMSLKEIRTYHKKLKCRTKFKDTLTVEPEAAFEALNPSEADPLTFEQYKKKVTEEILKKEKELREKRDKEKKSVLGEERLILQSIHREHTPKKHGKRMICISSDISLRVKYIQNFRAWVEKCRAVYRCWCEGNMSVPWPPGFYPPGSRPIASMIPAAFWS